MAAKTVTIASRDAWHVENALRHVYREVFDRSPEAEPLFAAAQKIRAALDAQAPQVELAYDEKDAKEIATALRHVAKEVFREEDPEREILRSVAGRMHLR